MSFERFILILKLPPGALPELSRHACRDLESDQGLPFMGEQVSFSLNLSFCSGHTVPDRITVALYD